MEILVTCFEEFMKNAEDIDSRPYIPTIPAMALLFSHVTTSTTINRYNFFDKALLQRFRNCRAGFHFFLNQNRGSVPECSIAFDTITLPNSESNTLQLQEMLKVRAPEHVPTTDNLRTLETRFRAMYTVPANPKYSNAP